LARLNKFSIMDFAVKEPVLDHPAAKGKKKARVLLDSSDDETEEQKAIRIAEEERQAKEDAAEMSKKEKAV